ncbi:putative sugar O-methyltransferase [Streptomyces broussonetiae]|uniref:Putative sugar O-methyltransferase n=1 Tax=Streptomyces broussonetiae TaxID=2686304 RepID=A0A6I6N2S4_9ACTN|nr:putative sugar O-methyltransferase [Streptomyces broussonetiae]QHA03155.1 putative sugar O-methyltransferase [Streptomyces broussonetiae]
MDQIFQASRQWERIQNRWITEDAAVDLTNLKSDPRNFKLSLWDPTTNGVRYLKALTYHLGMHLSPEEWARIKRTPNREIGDPITVRCEGESLCMDYLQATFELGFIEGGIDMSGARVLEIGAGYGRTCHMIMSNHDISGYSIVDLKNTLELSKAYLRRTLDDARFKLIEFIPVDSLEGGALKSERFELCINIHSMTEMSPDTVSAYLGLIDETCSAFYVKNPVGKYIDQSLDGYLQGQEAVQMALENGPLRQLVDIHDSQAVQAAVPAFINGYRPGDAWDCVSDSRALPWSYLWQALYRKPRTAPVR